MGNPATFAWRSRQDRRRAERDSLARLGEQASAGVAEGSAAGLARARALTNVTQRGERAQEYKARLSERQQEALSQPQGVSEAGRDPRAGGGGGGGILVG